MESKNSYKGAHLHKRKSHKLTKPTSDSQKENVSAEEAIKRL